MNSKNTYCILVLMFIILLPVESQLSRGFARENIWEKEIDLVYETKDGWKIHSTFYPSYKSQKPLLVSIHMLMSDRSYYPVKKEMVRHFSVLKIDMRGHGDSLLFKNKRTGWRSGRGNIYWGSFRDIKMGISEIARLYGEHVDSTRVFLQGSSYSCVLILQYYLRYPDNISGLIFMSPGDAYKQSIVDNYKKILYPKKTIPVFNVCSIKDPYCSAKTVRMKKLYNYFLKKYRLKQSKYLFEKEHVHGTHFFYTHSNKYPDVIVDWMNEIVNKTK